MRGAARLSDQQDQYVCAGNRKCTWSCEHWPPVGPDLDAVMPCPERCDCMEMSGRCSRPCAKDFRIDHEDCGCAQHRRACPSVVYMQNFFARHAKRRKCVSPGCPLTVGNESTVIIIAVVAVGPKASIT